MNSQQIGNIFRTLASTILICGNVWTVSTWIWESKWIILKQFGPPEYLTLIAFCTISVLIINYRWINGLRPSIRFQKLADEIERVRTLTSSSTSISRSSDLYVGIGVLHDRLNSLGLQPPNVNYSPAWPNYLAGLLVFAKLGKIKDARKWDWTSNGY